jgi:hypothetical protein
LSYLFFKNLFSISLAIILAMASDEVAAGDGALRTCSILSPNESTPESNTKSSTKSPINCIIQLFNIISDLN